MTTDPTLDPKDPVAPATTPLSAAAAASAAIEEEVGTKLLAYQATLVKAEELEAELDELRSEFPKLYAKKAEEIGIELEKAEEKSSSTFSFSWLTTPVILAGVAGVLAFLVFWVWWFQPLIQTPSAEVAILATEVPTEAVVASEIQPSVTSVAEVIIVVPTATAVPPTATTVPTAVGVKVPATSVPPTATAVPQATEIIVATAVSAPAPVTKYWNSQAKATFKVESEGAVCSGDSVAGVAGPVTIAFPANYGNVEVVWGRCEVNGMTAEQVAAADSAAHGKRFVVKPAP